MEAAEEKEDSKKNNVKQTKRKTDKRKDKSMASGKAFMYETIYNDLLEGTEMEHIRQAAGFRLRKNLRDSTE